MDNIQENQEYINPQEYGSMPLNTQNFSLKPPKRLMSAYACFSRSMWVQQSGVICRFKQVREELGDQPRQCDIFKVIAGRWKEMSPEEKAPFEEEVVIMAMESREGGKGPPAIQE